MRTIWLLVAVLLAGAPADAASLRRLAVIVAHRDGGPGAEPLLYPRDDARKLKTVLTELGGFRPEDTFLLVDPSAAEVEAALRRAEAEAARVQADGGEALLLFYYSGHARGGELLLGETRLAMARLRRLLAEARAAVRIAFLDACESGAITRLKGGRRAPSFIVDVEPARSARGHVIITSSSEDEASQESDEIRGSYFTHYLVSGLRGAADRSGDAQVTLGEAYAYAYDRTVAHTAQTRAGPQHPTYTYDLKGNGEVVLTRLAGLAGLVFPAEAAGPYLVYDVGRDVVVGEVQKPVGEARRLSVPPGRYAVEKRAPDHLLLLYVEVGPGEQRPVEEARFASVAFEDDVIKGPAWRRRIRERRRRFEVSARVGYQAFFDASARRELLHPGPLAGARIEWANLLGPRLSLHLDAAMGRTVESPAIGARGEPVPVAFLLAVAGAGLTWDRWLGDVRLQAGPRLTAVYARRDFLEDPLPFQDLFTVCPGLALGAATALGPVSVGLEIRAHYLRYATEAEDRSLGFGEGYLSLGISP